MMKVLQVCSDMLLPDSTLFLSLSFTHCSTEPVPDQSKLFRVTGIKLQNTELV